MAPPALDFVVTIDVEVDSMIGLGTTVQGIRRVVPIRGGTVSGPGLRGRVLDAGADIQCYPVADIAFWEATYVLELEDGVRVLVENHAIRTGDPEDLRRMMAGESVNPSRIYFRCAPTLPADDAGPHAWMNPGPFPGRIPWV